MFQGRALPIESQFLATSAAVNLEFFSFKRQKCQRCHCCPRAVVLESSPGYVDSDATDIYMYVIVVLKVADQ